MELGTHNNRSGAKETAIMDPLFAQSILLSAGHSIDDNFTAHPDRDREKVAWSPQEHRSLIQRARDASHALGIVLVGAGSRLQRPATAAPGSETAQ
jgi:hypothetical protein